MTLFLKVKSRLFLKTRLSLWYLRTRLTISLHSNSRIATVNMNTFEATLEMMVNSFTDANELMYFAATMGIQDSPIVRFRLFQLQNLEYDSDFFERTNRNVLEHLGGPINITSETITDDLEMALEYVKREEEIEESIKALLFDEEMDHIARICIEDGEWNPESLRRVREPQPGSAYNLNYTMKMKSEKTYAKDATVDRTYRMKVDERHHGLRLQDVQNGLHQIFEEVLERARGNLAGNDLGRVVIHHNGLHDPIIVPLQPWEHLNADKVMEVIEKVINSNQDLSIDDSFEITVGSIDLPKGGAWRRITKMKGEKNSLHLKKIDCYYGE